VTQTVRCDVPNVRRRTLAAARTRLRRAHCALGAVSRVYSGKVAKGLIVTQRPGPGARLARGGHVRVTVSRGRRG
jgi:serine/threonine-protein kinase